MRTKYLSTANLPATTRLVEPTDASLLAEVQCVSPAVARHRVIRHSRKSFCPQEGVHLGQEGATCVEWFRVDLGINHAEVRDDRAGAAKGEEFRALNVKMGVIKGVGGEAAAGVKRVQGDRFDVARFTFVDQQRVFVENFLEGQKRG